MDYQVTAPNKFRTYRTANRAVRSVSDVIAYAAGGGALGAAFGGPIGLFAGSGLGIAMAAASMVVSRRRRAKARQ